ncbi:MAG: TIGR04282 family arsenosugar biosynthesis glycosyltransferase [gamma proteobacterium symbiont of Taylorina sp.]|nr:TIGR04282 family arsenosugar biosynthesis glycosyltransferase [gamma proteobacterium symbiont of Taylorina sp.]
MFDNSHNGSVKFIYSDVLIIIFAREPQPGKVKTRLIPQLGENAATRLYTSMLEHALTTVIQSKLSSLDVCITLESKADYFLSISLHNEFSISRQAGKDLGERMYHALQTALKQYSRVILIGSDCPFINKEVLQQAIAALETSDMVFSPASDGGYVLVGAKNLIPAVFEEIHWGSEFVMQQTRKRLSAANISWTELSVQHDIDLIEDLKYLSDLPEFKGWV